MVSVSLEEDHPLTWPPQPAIGVRRPGRCKGRAGVEEGSKRPPCREPYDEGYARARRRGGQGPGIEEASLWRRSAVMAESEAGASRRGPEPRRGADPGAWVFLGLMVLITSTTATAAKFAVHELPI